MSGKPRYRTLEDRLAANSYVDSSTDCWLWIGARKSNGYATLTFWDRERKKTITRQAHAVSAELAHGRLPDGFEWAHQCPAGPTRHCIHPMHLAPRTHAENCKERKS